MAKGLNRARALLEMALGTGGLPDVIHPAHKQAFASGQHALGQHPAFTDPSKHEKHAGQTYQHMMRNAERYYGRMPQNQQDAVRVLNQVVPSLQRMVQIEAQHRPELERLAVETVLRMDEFKSVRRAIQSGDLKIDAKIELEPDIGDDIQMSDEPPEEEDPAELDIPEIRQEIDDAAHKRAFVNTLIQGATLTNNYAWSYHTRDEIQQIDPSLLQDYGKLMSATEMGYWVAPPEIAKAALKGQGGPANTQAGFSRLKGSEDGSTTIVARGIAFPVLVHEIMKGLMEYLSFDDEEDPETRKLVHSKADFADAEGVQMMLGPSLWRSFIDAAGGETREVIPYLYDHIVRMPNSEFNDLMRGLVDDDPAAKQKIRSLADQIRQEISGQEESLRQARKIIGG
jgi:hypothetical protein